MILFDDINQRGSMVSLKEQIRAHRARKGLSQEALGKRLGLTKGSVSAWETGRAFPSTKNLLMLADVFETTYENLVNGGKVLSMIKEDQSKYESVDEEELMKIFKKLRPDQRDSLKIIMLSMTTK